MSVRYSEKYEGASLRFVKRRNQKHIRIRIKPGEVIVSAPYGTPESEMKRFCREKDSWIREMLVKMHSRNEQINSLNRFDEGLLLHEGNWKKYTLKTHKKNLAGFGLTEDCFQITIPEGFPEVPDLVAGLYRKWATPFLSKRFWEVTDSLPFNPLRVTIRDQKTKWGSCSSKKNINLNWRLIKCPRIIQDYIIVHELCHLVYLNHSPSYWKLVETHFPRYKEAERWIKTNGPLVFQNP